MQSLCYTQTKGIAGSKQIHQARERRKGKPHNNYKFEALTGNYFFIIITIKNEHTFM